MFLCPTQKAKNKRANFNLSQEKSQLHRIEQWNGFFLGWDGTLLIGGHNVSGKQDKYVWEICSTTLYLK